MKTFELIDFATKHQFAIFPIKANSKLPATANGCKDASCDPHMLVEMFGDRDCNVGIEASRSGLILLDIDRKDGRDGMQSLQQLEARHGKLPATLSAKTPNGGLHFYFRGTGAKNRKDAPWIGDGIEVKAINQYLVMPPSSIDGKAYEWISKSAIAECPRWLIDLTQTDPRQFPATPTPRVAKTTKSSGQLLTPYDRAKLYVEKASGATTGNRNKAAFSLAGHLWAKFSELSEGEIIGLMSDWNTSCNPPLDQSELETATRSARVNGTPRQPGEAIQRQKITSKAAMQTVEQSEDVGGYVDQFADSFEFPFHKLPSAIQIIASYLAIETSDKVRIKHIMAAAAVVGALIGKRAEINNWGSEYYLNLAIAILMPSGGNKSGLYTVVKKLTRDIVSTFTPTACTIEGFLDRYCTNLPPCKTRTIEETKLAVQQIMLTQKADEAGEMVLVDEFRAMLLTMLPEQQATRNGQILCRMLDRDDIETSTATGGMRILADTCFTWLGFSQTDPWNNEIRSAQFQAGGLAARIIPVNSQRFDLVPVEPLPVTIRDVMRICSNIQQTVSGDFKSIKKIQVMFPDDGLTRAKKWFAEKQLVKDEGGEEFDLLSSKILMQSAKLAGIFAICDMVDPAGTVDANKWLRASYILIGYSHVGNLGHIAELTEQGKIMDSIKRVLKMKGPQTQRDIGRRTNLKTTEVFGYLRVMLEAGEIQKVEQMKCIKFKLT